VRFARLYAVAAAFDGLWWGCAAVDLPPHDRFDEQSMTIAVALIVATGAVPAFSSYFPAFIAILLPISTIIAVSESVMTGTLHLAVAALLLVFFVTVLSLGIRSNQQLAEMLRLRFERERLLDDVRHEKEAAEQANISKSRFLAAASHDLRQPVHALGMLTGALSHHPMSDEMRGLVGHIQVSVEAMDGLFSSLLDVSKLDAGVVEPRRSVFQIAPLLERVCADYSQEARRKAIELRVCHSSAYVDSDPVLLERVLRNVVSNAVRYTDRGGVLVGCRLGSRLSVQVLDTGRGIAAIEVNRIFEEFYQVGNPEVTTHPCAAV
jgi:two-component system, sensor histidine kinase